MTLIKFIKNIISLTLNKYKHIYSVSKLSIENPTCDLNSNAQFANVTFGKYVKIFENNKIFNSKIDSHSYIQMNGRIFNCSIGKFCSIAASVSIAPGIHDLKGVSTHPSLYQKSSPLPKVFAKNDNIITSKNVTIGHDVWIGEKVTILDGVVIGNGAVIASGAVVNKDVAPYAIVGGIPGKTIKYRFDEETIQLLQESKWWDNTEQWFEENTDLINDFDKFIEFLKCS
jgi:acetyltransferase-like isoleucine patch superfamily enzyme